MNNLLLSLNNIGLELPGLAQPILKNIDYKIYEKDFIILLGSNGSEKSSLLKILDRRYYAKGHVFLSGKELQSYTQKQLAKQIITLTQSPQESLFTSLTVLENYILTKEVHDSNMLSMVTVAEEVFLANYLAKFNKKLTEKLNTLVTNLSGGEQQALILALSILYPPKILLLDEHTAALDPQAAIKLMEVTAKIINENHITCILSTHDLALALNYGNRILALSNGEIVQDIQTEQKKHLSHKELLALCYCAPSEAGFSG